MLRSPWFVRKPDNRQWRLYCFSCAGGNAANFMTWQEKIGRDIEICAIQLPGRGARYGEVPYETITQIVEDITTQIHCDYFLPFAFFGHSLGAIIAFEVARSLASSGVIIPERLFVAGCDAPRVRKSRGKLHLLSDDAFIDKLREYDGTPPAILENEQLMELLLPTLRSDFALADNYSYQEGPLIPVPIIVMAGRSDLHTETDFLDCWGNETSAGCKFHWFEGGHFFVQSEVQAVINCVQENWPVNRKPRI